MSVFENNHNIDPANPQRQFDLLVDGELSEADRRTLLLQLEHEPDGWRRCALAFLEAQCWKAELGQIAPRGALDSARPEPVSQAEPNGRWQTWRQYAATTLAIAASFLLALVVVHSWSGGPHSPGTSVVEKAVKELPLPPPAAADGRRFGDGHASRNQVVGRAGRDRSRASPAPRCLRSGLARADSRCHSA